MSRILVGIVVLAVAGCSQERTVAVEENPVGALAIKPLPSYSVSSTSGDLKLELRSSSEAHVIQVRITNVGSLPIAAFLPDDYWTITLVPEDGPWTYLPLPPSEFHTSVNRAIGPADWRTIYSDEYVSGYPDLKSLVHGVLDEDGWYECTLVYDDAEVNGYSDGEWDDVSEIGKVSFPPIEVHVVDGTAIEWRPLGDG